MYPNDYENFNSFRKGRLSLESIRRMQRKNANCCDEKNELEMMKGPDDNIWKRLLSSGG
jgi:hypothetical protein